MNNRVRVLFLESQPTLLSDSQVHAVLMRHFDVARVEVHVACNAGEPGARPPSFTVFESLNHVHVVPTRFGGPISGQGRVRRLGSAARTLLSALQLGIYIKRNRIDVIHTASRPRDALLAVILGKVTKTKSLIHLHVMVSDWFGRPIRWSLSKCDAILCISEFVRQSVVEHGYDPRKTYCVLNGLVADDWDPDIDGTSVRRELGICPDAVVLAIISRLFSWKGHTELFRALARIREKEPGFRLIVVGEDDPLAHPGGGSYREELEVLAHELGIHENVIFTGFRKDISRVLAACDLYTMPSFEEPLGVAFLEAMAMCKPVIALSSGGVPEVVEDGATGLLSAPGDIEGLAANILALIRDPVRRLRMGRCGRERVQRNHNPTQLALQTEAIYWRISNHGS